MRCGGAVDMRSTAGNMFTMQGAPIAWNSKTQPTIAMYKTESEYMAMSSAMQEALRLRNLYREMSKDVHPIQICCDNRSAFQKGTHTIRAQCKHIDVKHHFLRELIALNESDFLTEALIIDKKNYRCDELNLKRIALKHELN